MKKYLKKTQKEEANGITLVALVVTIIVLLILAGVTIMLLFSENGIIKKAQKAKEVTRAGMVEEARDFWKLNQQLDEYMSSSSTETLEQLLEKLVKEGTLTEQEKAEIEETGQITIGEKTIVFGKAAKTLVDAFKDGEINIGDYLNYKPISGKKVELTSDKTGYNGTQTYTVDSTTTWRVLGLSEDESQLLIISGSPIKRDGDDPYFHLASGEGVTYAEEDLDKICNIYYNSKYASQAKSMRMEDITRVLGITIDKENNKAYKTNDATKTELPYQGFFGQTYTYKSGDYAVENYMGTGSVKVGDTVNGSAYMVPCTESAIVDQTSIEYEILFKGTTQAENNSKAYWLASSGVRIDGGSAGFGPGVVYYGYAISGGCALFRSGGVFDEYWMAVRPVVSLRSDISVDDLQVIEGSEPEWTTTVPDSWNGESLTKGQVLEN